VIAWIQYEHNSYSHTVLSK